MCGANQLRLADLRADNELMVRAMMAYPNSGEGLHRFTDPADNEVYLYAQAALDDAQRVFACLDQPDLKAALRLRVTAPAQWRVWANGAGTRTEPGRSEFAETPPISTYHFTKATGYAADQRPSTHPVAPEHVPDTAAAMLNFDGISYAKGASALRQLVAWTSDEAFLTGLRSYLGARSFGNATLARRRWPHPRARPRRRPRRTAAAAQ